MITATLTIISICAIAIGYSYVLYPLLLSQLIRNHKFQHQQYNEDDNLPFVAILLSALNEEKVIQKKIESIFATSYPIDKIDVYVGSDHSTDTTNQLLTSLSAQFPRLHVFYFAQRRGKANVLNSMQNEINKKATVVILTDANVMFTSHTLFHLCKHFKDSTIGQVGANIINQFNKENSIARQENFYIQRENKIKHHEGLFGGSMIGAFGACYAIRRDLLIDFKSTFLMEDFYLSLSILEKKYKAILDLDAVCHEDLPGNIEEEYKRKRRISAGNYQNMMAYPSLVWNLFSKVGFCYWSHKILRWTTPLFLIIIAIGLIILTALNFFTIKCFILVIVLSAIFWISDIILEKAHKQIVVLRFARYFILMNLAMLQGFLMYTKGIKTNVWTPTQRSSE